MKILSSAIFVALLGNTTGFVTNPAFTNELSSRQTSRTSSSTELEMVATSVLQKAAVKVGIAAGTAALAGTGFVKLVLDKPSRPYTESSVGDEYDEWTEQGIVEYYWGEHIHLGYYSAEEKYKYKPLNEAQYTFIDKMMEFGGIDPSKDGNAKVLDVGCGFGGTSRYLARKLGPNAEVTGITLSPKQVERASELAVEQETPNAKFMVEDALVMPSFPDNSFDIVWACESGEHMPDKKKYIEQMMRVLKPGGKFVMATWCQRDDREVPFDKRDKRDLQYLYEEWSHPYFISKEAYKELVEGTGLMNTATAEDWARETIASWRHTLWLGIKKPWGWLRRPRRYMRCFRDGYCIERFHRGFKRGLLEYGMITATKKKEETPKPDVTSTSTPAP